jgi:hypothetical protein
MMKDNNFIQASFHDFTSAPRTCKLGGPAPRTPVASSTSYKTHTTVRAKRATGVWGLAPRNARLFKLSVRAKRSSGLLGQMYSNLNNRVSLGASPQTPVARFARDFPSCAGSRTGSPRGVPSYAYIGKKASGAASPEGRKFRPGTE